MTQTTGLTSAQRDENRLSDEDRSAMREAVRRLLCAGGTVGSDLRRVAYRAIGCGYYDLRDSEVDWVARMVEYERRLFTAGTVVNVLPDKQGCNFAHNEGWTVVGPTRHAYALCVREPDHGTTIHIDADRLIVV